MGKDNLVEIILRLKDQTAGSFKLAIDSVDKYSAALKKVEALDAFKKLRQQTIDAQQSYRQAQLAVISFSKEIQSSKSSIAEQGQAIKFLKDSVKEASSALKTSETALKTLEAAYASGKAAIKAYEAESNALKASITGQGNIIKGLQTGLANLQAAQRASVKELSQQEKEFRKTQSAMSAFEKTTAAGKASIESFNSKIASSKSIIESQGNAIKEMKSKIAEASSALKASESSLKTLEGTYKQGKIVVDGYGESSNKLRSAIMDEASTLKGLKSELTSLQSSQSAANNDLKKQEAAFRSSKLAADDFSQVVKKNKETLSALKTELASVGINTEKLGTEEKRLADNVKAADAAAKAQADTLKKSGDAAESIARQRAEAEKKAIAATKEKAEAEKAAAKAAKERSEAEKAAAKAQEAAEKKAAIAAKAAAKERSEAERQAAAAAKSAENEIAAARANIGVRSIKQVQAEINKLISDYKLLKSSGTAGPKELATALDLVKTKVKAIKEDFSKFGNSVKTEFKTAATAVKAEIAGIERLTATMSISLSVIGGALSAPFAIGVKNAAAFQDEMAAVGAISSATSSEFMQLTNVAEEMGRTTRYTAVEAAQGLRFMSMAGLEASTSIKALPSMLQLAAAGALDLGTAADISTNIMSGYGMQAEDLTRINDVLVQGFTNSNSTLQELGTAFSYVGPVAKATGIEFEEVVATLGQLANAGIKASLGGTSLRGVLAALENPSKKARGILQQLGESIGQTTIQIRNADGTFIGMTNLLTQLEKASLNTSQAMAIFGVRAGPSMIALLEQGIPAFEKLNDKMLDSEGRAAKVAQEMENTLGGAFRRLTSATDGLTKSIGDSFVPLLTTLANTGAQIINWITDLRNLLGPLTIAFDLLGGSIASAVLGIGVAGLAFQHLLPGVKEVITELGFLRLRLMAVGAATANVGASNLGFMFAGLVTSIKAATLSIVTFLATNPVGWFVLAASAITGAVVAYNYFSGAIDRSIEKQKDLVSSLSGPVNAVQRYEKAIKNVSTESEEFLKANKKFKENLDKTAEGGTKLADAAREASKAINGITGELRSGGTDALQKYGELAKQIEFEAIATKAQLLGEKLKQVAAEQNSFVGILEKSAGGFDKLGEYVVKSINPIESLIGFIKELGKNILGVEGISGVFKSIQDSAKATYDWLTNSFIGIKDKGLDAAEGIKKYFQDTWDSIANTVVFQDLKAGFEDLKSQISSIASDISTKFSNIAAPVVNALKPITDFLSSIKEKTVEVGKETGGALTTWAGIVKDSFLTAFNLKPVTAFFSEITKGSKEAAMSWAEINKIATDSKTEKGMEAIRKEYHLTDRQIKELVKSHQAVAAEAQRMIDEMENVGKLDYSKTGEEIKAIAKEMGLLTNTTDLTAQAFTQSFEKMKTDAQDAADSMAASLERSLDPKNTGKQVKDLTKAYIDGMKLLEGAWLTGNLSIGNVSKEMNENLRQEYISTFESMEETSRTSFIKEFNKFKEQTQAILNARIDQSKKDEIIQNAKVEFNRKINKIISDDENKAAIEGYSEQLSNIKDFLEKKQNEIEFNAGKGIITEKKAQDQIHALRLKAFQDEINLAQKRADAAKNLGDDEEYKKALKARLVAQKQFNDETLAQMKTQQERETKEREFAAEQAKASGEIELEDIKRRLKRGELAYSEAAKLKVDIEGDYLEFKLAAAEQVVTDAIAKYGKDTAEHKKAVLAKIKAEEEYYRFLDGRKEAIKTETAALEGEAEAIKKSTDAKKKNTKTNYENAESVVIVSKGIQGVGELYRQLQDRIEAVNISFSDLAEKFSTLGSQFQEFGQEASDTVAIGMDNILAKTEALSIGIAEALAKPGTKSIEHIERSLDGFEELYDRATDYIQKLIDAQEELNEKIEDAVTARMEVEQESADFIKDLQKTVAGDVNKSVQARIDYEEEYSKGVEALRKGEYEVAKDYFLKAQSLTKDMVQDMQKFADEILGIEKSTSDKLRDLRQSLLSDVEKYEEDKRLAQQKSVEATKAMMEGEFELAKTLALEAQDLFAGLAGEVKDAEGNIVYSIEQTTQTAMKGVEETGKLAKDVLEQQSAAANASNAEAIAMAEKAGGAAIDALDEHSNALKRQGEENEKAIAKTQEQINILIGKMNNLAEAVNQNLTVDIKTAAAEKALDMLTDKYGAAMGKLVSRTFEVETAMNKLNMGISYAGAFRDAYSQQLKGFQQEIRTLAEYTEKAATSVYDAFDISSSARGKSASAISQLSRLGMEEGGIVNPFAQPSMDPPTQNIATLFAGQLTLSDAMRRMGYAKGGEVDGTGGIKIPGFGLVDTVPALLTEGERVIRSISTKVMDTVVPGFMDAVNKVKSPSDVLDLFRNYVKGKVSKTEPKYNAGGLIPKFATGGIVPRFAGGGIIQKFAEGGQVFDPGYVESVISILTSGLQGIVDQITGESNEDYYAKEEARRAENLKNLERAYEKENLMIAIAAAKGEITEKEANKKRLDNKLKFYDESLKLARSNVSLASMLFGVESEQYKKAQEEMVKIQDDINWIMVDQIKAGRDERIQEFQKERAARLKIIEAAYDKENLAVAFAEAKEEISGKEADQKNLDNRLDFYNKSLSLAQSNLSQVANLYGQESDEYRAAQEEIAKIQKDIQWLMVDQAKLAKAALDEVESGGGDLSNKEQEAKAAADKLYKEKLKAINDAYNEQVVALELALAKGQISERNAAQKSIDLQVDKNKKIQAAANDNLNVLGQIFTAEADEYKAAQDDIRDAQLEGKYLEVDQARLVQENAGKAYEDRLKAIQDSYDQQEMIIDSSLSKGQISEQEAAQRSLDIQKDRNQQILDAANQNLAAISAVFNKESDEYKAAQDEIVAAQLESQKLIIDQESLAKEKSLAIFDEKAREIENAYKAQLGEIEKMAVSGEPEKERQAADELIKLNLDKNKSLVDLAKERLAAIGSLYSQDSNEYKAALQDQFEAQLSYNDARMAQSKAFYERERALKEENIALDNERRAAEIAAIDMQEQMGVISKETANQKKAEIDLAYAESQNELMQENVDKAAEFYGVDSAEYKRALSDKLASASVLYDATIKMINANEAAGVISHQQAVDLKKAAEIEFAEARLVGVYATNEQLAKAYAGDLEEYSRIIEEKKKALLEFQKLQEEILRRSASDYLTQEPSSTEKSSGTSSGGYSGSSGGGSGAYSGTADIQAFMASTGATVAQGSVNVSGPKYSNSRGAVDQRSQALIDRGLSQFPQVQEQVGKTVDTITSVLDAFSTGAWDNLKDEVESLVGYLSLQRTNSSDFNASGAYEKEKDLSQELKQYVEDNNLSVEQGKEVWSQINSTLDEISKAWTDRTPFVMPNTVGGVDPQINYQNMADEMLASFNSAVEKIPIITQSVATPLPSTMWKGEQPTTPEKIIQVDLTLGGNKYPMQATENIADKFYREMEAQKRLGI